MAAGAWTITNTTLQNTANGTFDWDSDTFKIALLTSSITLAASTGAFSTVSTHEFSGNGYAAQTASITLTTSGAKLYVDSTDVSYVASGGSITAKWACLHESGGNVALYCLLDSTSADVTTTDGNTLTIQIAADGVFAIS